MRNDIMRFRFVKAAPALKGELQLCVAPLSTAKLAHASLGLTGPRWTDEATEQLAKKLKASEKSSEMSARAARVDFSDGSSCCLLFVQKGISSFELATELRKAFAEALKSSLEGKPVIHLIVSKLGKDDQKRVLEAVSFLAETVSWEPMKFGNAAKKAKKSVDPELVVHSTLPEAQAERIAQRGMLLGQANNRVRTLADLPANELNPKSYRERARAFAKEHGLEFEFWGQAELTKRKAGSFLAVVRAEPKTEAGIVCLRYVPKKAKRKVLALVGKGVCFDTGGYNIKPGQYMLGMHSDMTGSALALALCGYFARMKVDFEVRAYLALAENLISPTAYKPNEVVIASDGTAIEVIDTDAEGRMLLADTLALARQSKPDLMIDYATLTGAAIRSVDTRKSVVFSNREKLAQRAVKCGERSGERVWTFPIEPDDMKMLESKIADVLQCADGHNADHIYAAAFLSRFAGDTPWVHVDLSSRENKGGLGLIETSTTGFGALWTDAFVRESL